jgi:hypothetical protein
MHSAQHSARLRSALWLGGCLDMLDSASTRLLRYRNVISRSTRCPDRRACQPYSAFAPGGLFLWPNYAKLLGILWSQGATATSGQSADSLTILLTV